MTTAHGRKAGAVLLVVHYYKCMRRTNPCRPCRADSTTTRRQPLDGLTGAYTLTIDLPAACAELPEAERRRIYEATLDRRPISYRTGIRIVGAGYDRPDPGR